MKTTKVLVTGVKGFIGSRLDARFKMGTTTVVRGGKNHQENTDVTDMRSLRSLEEQEIEAIIHLAAKSSVVDSFEKPYEAYRTNVLGTLNVLELARLKNIKKFIFVSTYVYGQPTYLPIDENHPVNPHSPYHRSKLIAEQLCKNYSNDFGINIATLRPFYIYGPDSRAHPFISSAIMQIKRDQKVKLSGEYTKRDFLFVNDFVDLINSVLNNFPDGYNLYNVGYGKSYSLKEVSYLLADLLNMQIKIEYNTKMRPNDVSDMIADISKVSAQFSWKPSTTLEEGLRLCVDYSAYTDTLRSRDRSTP